MTGPVKFERMSLKVPFQAFVDIEERTCLLAVAPDFDLSPVSRFGDLPAEGGRRLFPPTLPGAQRTENIVIPGNPHFQAVIAGKGQIQAFAEQFLPAIVAVGKAG